VEAVEAGQAARAEHHQVGTPAIDLAGDRRGRRAFALDDLGLDAGGRQRGAGGGDRGGRVGAPVGDDHDRAPGARGPGQGGERLEGQGGGPRRVVGQDDVGHGRGGARDQGRRRRVAEQPLGHAAEVERLEHALAARADDHEVGGAHQRDAGIDASEQVHDGVERGRVGRDARMGRLPRVGRHLGLGHGLAPRRRLGVQDVQLPAGPHLVVDEREGDVARFGAVVAEQHDARVRGHAVVTPRARRRWGRHRGRASRPAARARW
jgi:hypothetical protein